MCEKMMCNNPNVDLVKIYAYIKLGKILSICSQDIERKRNFGVNQGPLHWYKCAKMMCNNPNLDLVNMNAYIKFGDNQSTCFQDNERKRNFDINQGP